MQMPYDLDDDFIYYSLICCHAESNHFSYEVEGAADPYLEPGRKK